MAVGTSLDTMTHNWPMIPFVGQMGGADRATHLKFVGI
jgi:hypothetical protein